MFELPSLEQVIKTVLITALAYYAYHISKEQEEESQKRAKEQKELIDSTTHPILSQEDFKCHMQTCLSKLSSGTLNTVTITDKQNTQKWVLLKALEYEKLCDRAETFGAVEIGASMHIHYADGSSKTIPLGDMLIKR